MSAFVMLFRFVHLYMDMILLPILGFNNLITIFAILGVDRTNELKELMEKQILIMDRAMWQFDSGVQAHGGGIQRYTIELQKFS